MATVLLARKVTSPPSRGRAPSKQTANIVGGVQQTCGGACPPNVDVCNCQCSPSQCVCAYCRTGFYCTDPGCCCSAPSGVVCGACEFCCSSDYPTCCSDPQGCCEEDTSCCGNYCCSNDDQSCCKDDDESENSICCDKNYQCCNAPSTDGTKLEKECVTKPSSLQTAVNIPFVLPAPNANQLRVFALPVGQGDCTVIQCPGNTRSNVVVVDCGTSPGSGGYTWQNVQQFLPVQYTADVYVMVSHPDRDHFNYLYYLELPNIRRVVLGGTRNNYNTDANMSNWLKKLESAQPGTVQVVSGGQSCMQTKNACIVTGGVDFCRNPDVVFSILAANVGTTSNTKSIILKVTYKNWRILLPGDMENPTATALAGALGALLAVDTYKVAHHGASNKANQPDWLAQIKPTAAFASNGYNYGKCRHPRCLAIHHLLQLGTILPDVTARLDCGIPNDVMVNPNFCHKIYATAPAPNASDVIQIYSNGTPNALILHHRFHNKGGKNNAYKLFDGELDECEDDDKTVNLPNMYKELNNPDAHVML